MRAAARNSGIDSRYPENSLTVTEIENRFSADKAENSLQKCYTKYVAEKGISLSVGGRIFKVGKDVGK